MTKEGKNLKNKFIRDKQDTGIVFVLFTLQNYLNLQFEQNEQAANGAKTFLIFIYHKIQNQPKTRSKRLKRRFNDFADLLKLLESHDNNQ